MKSECITSNDILNKAYSNIINEGVQPALQKLIDENDFIRDYDDTVHKFFGGDSFADGGMMLTIHQVHDGTFTGTWNNGTYDITWDYAGTVDDLLEKAENSISKEAERYRYALNDIAGMRTF